MGATDYIKKFFDKKVYRSEWEVTTDKSILFADFKEYVEQRLSYTDQVRMMCYADYRKRDDIVLISKGKTLQIVKNTLTRLNRSLELEVKNEGKRVYSYRTTGKGLKMLIVALSNFYRDNKYLQEFTKHNIETDIFDSREVIKAFHSFINDTMSKEIKKAISQDAKYFEISFPEMCEFDYMLADKLLENPIEVISIMEETLFQFFETDESKKTPQQEKQYIRVRILDLPESENIKIGNHRQVHINKLVSFDGIIRRKSDVKPRLKYLKYLCTNPACSMSENMIKVPQFEEKARVLKACPKCKSGIELMYKILEDSMFLILEQDFSERAEDFDSKKIHIKLDADLTDEKKYNKLRISDKIRVIGILREIAKPTKGGAESINYDYLLEANNIIFLEQQDDMVLNPEDIKQIQEFANDKECFVKMRNCYLPRIYGNGLIKEALMLQHIGSSFKSERNDSHLLLLGDPSTGKTEMIVESLNYNVRHIYASGTSSTKAGLSATAIKDELTGSWVLEGGVLPRANGGIAGCDELDKLSPEDADSLTEALEQQVISVNKANISAQLQTKCAFLAGANPKYGKFDMSMDITKQINFNPALLSRFDLIFVLRDVPEESRDESMIGHILTSYESNEDTPEPECEDFIDFDFIKKYLYYCKTNFKPVLSKQAKDMISKYYVTVRKNVEMNHYINFTPRQIKGVIRFATAYAKFHHKNIIDDECIKYAYNLFNRVLSDLGTANITAIQNSMLSESISAEKAILKHFLSNDSKKITFDEIKEHFTEIPYKDLRKIIELLKKRGEIYEPIKDTYMLIK